MTRLALRHTCITLFISIVIKYTGDVQGDFLISFGFSPFSPFLHSTRLAVIYMNVIKMILVITANLLQAYKIWISLCHVILCVSGPFL